MNKHECTINTAPVISGKVELELFRPMDIQTNLAFNNSSPAIFDTGASLAITGEEQVSLPNTLTEVATLKLGDVAAGAAITGVENVAWIFPCNKINWQS